MEELEVIQIWNKVKWDLTSQWEEKKSVQVAKNMIILCKQVFFAVKLRNNDMSVLVSIVASGRSADCHFYGFGSFSLEQ